MKCNIKKTLLALFLFLGNASITLTAAAQDFTSQAAGASLERRMLLKTVDLLEDYRRYSSMDEDFRNYGQSFRDLFVSDNVLIYNDIIGVARGEYITVRDYADLMTTKSSTSRIEIKNIIRDEWYSEDDTWKVQCHFDKYVNITDGCGVEFASDFYNASDYSLTAVIVYDEEHDQCRFEKITGSAERMRELPDDYRVIKRTQDLDDKVKIGGESLVFNSVGQAIVPSAGKPKYKDPNSVIRLVTDNADCKLYHLKLKLKRWNIKLHYDMSRESVFEIGKKNTNDQNAFLLNNEEEKAYGIDFCYVVPSRSSFKVGFGFGGAFTESKLSLAIANRQFHYSTNADVDGDTYTRNYQNFSMSQDIEMQSVTAPVYLDFGIYFNKYVALVFDAGVKLHYNLSANVTNTTGSAYVYGIYGSEYADIRLDENFGYNGFGQIQYSMSDLDSRDIIDVSKFSVDAFGSAGLRINIPGTPLALDVNASYQMGVMNDLINTSNVLNYSNAHNSIAYNTVSGATSTEHLRNLTELVSNIKRKGMKINMGLIIRL